MSTRASRRDVTRLRLERHGLVDAGLTTPLAVAERLLAMQAQDYPATKWAFGVRSPGISTADVDAALASGQIVRSWPMRGTLHFVPAVELGWMLQLTTARMLAATKGRHAQLELEHSDFEHARDVALGALAGGGEISRAEFLAVLERHGISTAGQRGAHLIGQLAQTATLCWGPQVGTQQMLVLFDEWIPRPRRLERDEALGEFVLRYFTGHGPATLRDFVWWSHLTVADAKVGLEVARPFLSELDVDGERLYLPASAETGEPGAPARQRSPVLALPGFDEYLLGYQDRSFAVEDERLSWIVPGKNGFFLPFMTSAGRVIGTWRRQTRPKALTIEPRPFDGLNARQVASFRSAIRHYSRFTGVPATVLPPSTGVPGESVPVESVSAEAVPG